MLHSQAPPPWREGGQQSNILPGTIYEEDKRKQHIKLGNEIGHQHHGALVSVRGVCVCVCVCVCVRVARNKMLKVVRIFTGLCSFVKSGALPHQKNVPIKKTLTKLLDFSFHFKYCLNRYI